MVLIDILLLPLRAVQDTAADMYEILKTWKLYALEYEASYRRQQVCTLLHMETYPARCLRSWL